MKLGSIEVGPPAAQGETRARRSYLSVHKLVTKPHADIVVLADVLKYAVQHFPQQKALGWRDTIRMVEEEKEVVKDGVKEMKKWSYFELSEYKWWTYSELAEVVKQASSALVETGHTKDTIFNIYSSTKASWQVMANACARQGITFATAYDSLGKEGLQHSIDEPQVYGIFTNANLLGTIASVIKRTPSLKVIVYDGSDAEVPKGALETIQGAPNEVRVFTLHEFLMLGENHPHPANHPEAQDVATIMYTSGSTGAPKGVLLSNENIVAALGGVNILLKDVLRDGVFLAYLPLAHIFEFTVELYAIMSGIPVGYGTIKTLTDASVRNCVGDLRCLRPTIMIGVPAVWELIKKGIDGKVKHSGAVSQFVFHRAIAAKKMFGTKGLVAALTDKLVFSAVKEATGGRLKIAVNGGAPIGRATQEFLSLALVEIITGFGMTETSALSTILTPEFFQYGAVGIPVPSCEIKLVDFAEAGYFATNTPPQGEVWIRGPSVSKGYFKRPDLTEQEFTADGWIKTGDVAQWNKDGTLSIIDRKKNLVKLAGGEYIAVERLESVYKGCIYVSHICLIADPSASKAMAIIVPHEANLRLLPAANGRTDLEVLCADKEIQKAVQAELNSVAKQAGLKPLETLQTIILTHVEWTAQNGFLTAAQKLQRKNIQSEFKTQISSVYP